MPIPLDHYTTQFITGHGDFNQKLHSMKIKPSPSCQCGDPEDSAQHVLFECPLYNVQRLVLDSEILADGGSFPCPPSELVKTRRRYTALAAFSKAVLTEKMCASRNLL